MRAHGHPVVFINVRFRADYADAISQSARLARLKKERARDRHLGPGIPRADQAAARRDDLHQARSESVLQHRAADLAARARHRRARALRCPHAPAVDSTARYADDCGFVVKVIEDCCASPDPELHRIEIDKILPLFGEIVSSDELIGSL